MQLADQPASIPQSPWNYGHAQPLAALFRHLATVCILVTGLTLLTSVLANAQQAGQSGYDPRQTEQRFDDLQFGPPQATRHALRMPALARPAVTADNKPLFVLRGVTIVGARSMSNDQLAAGYQSYLGKQVSQSDLASIAAQISDLYRGAG